MFSLIRQIDKTFTEYDYLRSFDRDNLCRGPAPESDAGLRALWPRIDSEYRGRHVVIFGHRVAQAAGLRTTPEPACPRRHGRLILSYLPHPSGRNRWYNEASNRLMAAEFLHGLVRRG